MEWLTVLFTTQNLIALVTLTSLEIILGIDNVVFLTILVEKLPLAKQEFARRTGLLLAMIMRILLLFAVSWMKQLKTPLFSIGEHEITIHSLILIVGGLFLIGKATWEIRAKFEELEEGLTESDILKGESKPAGPTSTMAMVLMQILVLDFVFSIDSVITAVGMSDVMSVIVVAIVISVGVMMVFAEAIGRFVSQNPTIKMLALAFLILIGVALVIEGIEHEFNKGYIYSAMGFALFVELMNLKVIKGSFIKKRARKRKQIRQSQAKS